MGICCDMCVCVCVCVYGEGNGNPLQYSCLENPRDRGARWAAIYGVTQSRTQLKQVSSIYIPECEHCRRVSCFYSQ